MYFTCCCERPIISHLHDAVPDGTETVTGPPRGRECWCHCAQAGLVLYNQASRSVASSSASTAKTNTLMSARTSQPSPRRDRGRRWAEGVGRSAMLWVLVRNIGPTCPAQVPVQSMSRNRPKHPTSFRVQIFSWLAGASWQPRRYQAARLSVQ